MANKKISVTKILFSDIVLTFKQFFKKSSLIFLIIFLLTYFFFPINEFININPLFTNIFSNSFFYMNISVLIIALAHFFYAISMVMHFKHIKFKELLNTNKINSLKCFLLSVATFYTYFLLAKIFPNDNLKAFNFWLYIFLNYFKILLAYLIVSIGTILIIDKKTIKIVFPESTAKNFILVLFKILLTITLIALILSPILYSIENELFYLWYIFKKSNSTFWSCFVIECIINIFIVMFTYYFVGLLIYNKNQIIMNKKTLKIIYLFAISFIYLYIWFTFGVCYQNIANNSNGRDFIFQDNLRVKLQAKALKSNLNINADVYTIGDLIKNKELEKDVISFKKENNTTNFTMYNSDESITYKSSEFDFNQSEGILCLDEIGEYWGALYCSNFYNNGATNYTYEIGENINSPTGIGFKNPKLCQVTILLYKALENTQKSYFPSLNRITLLEEPIDASQYSLVNKAYILIENNSIIEKLKNNKTNKGINSKYINLNELLQHSINFINNDYNKIKDDNDIIQREGFRFPLLDFLYFSAVTITTTGYGDILPNSTIVRSLVMAETIFGIALPGLFISLIFLKVDEK